MAEEAYTSFSEVRARLDEIVVEVRKKDLSLERSLDLYEEAIELGNRCAELVDRPDFTPQEALAAREVLDNAASGVTLSGREKPAPEDAGADERAAQAAEGETADNGGGEGAQDPGSAQEQGH